MRRFERYEDAYNAAVLLARACKHDAYIRRQREFGRDGFNIGLHCPTDGGFPEVVKPTDPLMPARGED